LIPENIHAHPKDRRDLKSQNFQGKVYCWGAGVGEPKKNRVRGVEIFWNGTFILPNATKYANKLDKKTLHSN